MMDFFLSPGDNVAIAHVIIQIKLYLKRLNVDSTSAWKFLPVTVFASASFSISIT